MTRRKTVANPVLTFTISIDRDGTPHSRTQTHGSTFAEAYNAFHKIRDEVDHQIADRRQCPANPGLTELEIAALCGGKRAAAILRRRT